MERMNAALGLPASHTDYRSLFEAIDVGVVYHSADGSITEANAAATRIIGLSPEELQGRTTMDPSWHAVREDGSPFPGEEHPAMVALRTGQAVRGVVVGIRPSTASERRWLLVDAFPERPPGETMPSRAFAVFRDITAQRQGELALKQEQAWLQSADSARRTMEALQRTVLANLDVGVIAVSPNGRVLDWNPAALAMHGYESPSDEHACLERISSGYELHTVDGEALSFEQWPIPRILRGECFKDWDLVLRRRTVGWERVFCYSGSLIRGPDGLPLLGLLTMRDVTERRAAEKQVASWKHVFAATDFGLAISDARSNTFIEVNPAFARRLGYAPSELAGRSIMDVIAPEARHELLERIPEIHRQGHLVTETVHLRRDGSCLPVLLEVTTIRDARGEPEVRVAYALDLTERKRAEEALRQAEWRLRRAAEAGNVGLWEWDLAEGTVHYSAQWKRQIGYQDHEIGSAFKEWERRVHPDDLPPTLSRLRSFLDDDSSGLYELEFRFLHRDGSYRWILAHASVERDASGAPLRILGSHVDITERKRAEERLRENEARVRTILSALTEGVILFNPAGEVETANDAVQRILGTGGGQLSLAGRDPHPPLVRSDGVPIPLDLHPAMQALRTGEPVEDVELGLRHADGTPRWLVVNARPARGPDGQVLGAVASFFDITARRQIEEELRRKNEELTRFTYTVSHDLKSPLVTIRTFLGYLEEDLDGDPERLQADLGYIRGAAEKMTLLLDGLLELSRIGCRTTTPAEVSLKTLVAETLDLLAGALAARQARVEVTDTPIALHGDRLRLLQVFQNLIDNAIKFMGDQAHPLVQIGAERLGTETVIFVRDNGVGIDPRHVPKLFRLFEKLQAGSAGVGLGLALVRRIIEVHGGRIWVESAGQGRGTTFRFTLPGPGQR